MSLFLLQLRGELIKLYARKRTWLGFGVFLALMLVILGLLQLEPVRAGFRRVIVGSGFGFEEYFSGLTVAFLILSWTVFLLGTLYVAMVSGDIVAKEVEDGTMRMILSRPAGRTRVLCLKFLACVVYTFSLVFFVSVVALALGVGLRGVGGMFVFEPSRELFALYGAGEGLVRYASGTILLVMSMTLVACLAFLLSCLPIKPAAAAIATLSYLFMDLILSQVPYFESVKGWFITPRVMSWMEVFRDPVPVELLAENYAVMFALGFTMLAVAAAIFLRRDFKA